MIEAVVVIGMIGIVGAVVLANFPILNQQIALRRSAQDLNTAIRKAQNMSLAVRIARRKDNSLRIPPYFGVYVESEQLMGVASTSYYIFADFNNSRRYELGGANNSDSVLEVIHTLRPVIIKNVKADSGVDRDKLHVTFRIPDGRTFIRGENCDPANPSICLNGSTNRPSACVRLEAPNGTFLSIAVRETGQVVIDEDEACD